MRIISWNVNGLRANVKKGGFDWFLNESPDIYCLQETKAHPDQLDEAIRNPAQYVSYFDHSKTRKGYSGVAIYVKKDSPFGMPDKVDYGMGIPDLDAEGRFLGLFFKNTSYGNVLLINLYFPNGGGGPERLDYKLRFYDAFLTYINKQRKNGYEIIFCGDVNTAHTEIDLARPKENEKNTGFLPVERAWIDQVLEAGYTDVFRYLYPNVKDKYTYWDMKTFARDRNVGWRIDYFFVTPAILKHTKDALILNDVFQSDHCPTELVLK